MRGNHEAAGDPALVHQGRTAVGAAQEEFVVRFVEMEFHWKRGGGMVGSLSGPGQDDLALSGGWPVKHRDVAYPLHQRSAAALGELGDDAVALVPVGGGDLHLDQL